MIAKNLELYRTISARMETEQLENFKLICDKLKVNPSDFLRACCIQLTELEEPEDFLRMLGFTKKTTWVYQGFDSSVQTNVKEESRIVD